MQRIIVVPAGIDEAGLAELKQWLGISRNNEDLLLAGLLAAALDLCEAFTGQMPLEQTAEEALLPQSGQQRLRTRPVRSIISAQMLDDDGGRSPIDESAYVAEITACGTASFRLTQPVQGRAIVVQMVAGIAPDWASLPAGLRQGIIRLAAHHYRDRDTDGLRNPAPPPASVTALWQPWRLMRLA